MCPNFKLIYLDDLRIFLNENHFPLMLMVTSHQLRLILNRLHLNSLSWKIEIARRTWLLAASQRLSISCSKKYIYTYCLVCTNP